MNYRIDHVERSPVSMFFGNILLILTYRLVSKDQILPCKIDGDWDYENCTEARRNIKFHLQDYMYRYTKLMFFRFFHVLLTNVLTCDGNMVPFMYDYLLFEGENCILMSLLVLYPGLHCAKPLCCTYH